LLGGLPMTSVVVRTSANNDAGAKSKMSSIIHGVLLLISVLAIPVILNKIPLATLAAVLLMVGYKLAVPNIKHFADYMPKEVNLLLISLVLVIIGYTNSVSAIAISALAVITVFILLYCFYKSSISIEFKKNVTRNQYIYFPFFATTLAVVFTDLLKGVALGMIISIIFVLRGNMQRAYNFRKEVYKDGDIIHIDLAQEVSFLNKAAVKTTLNSIPDNSKVIINASDTVYIAHDVLDLIKEFKKIKAKEQNIKVKLIGFKKVYELENTDETSKKNVFVEQKPSQN
jgi:MFS superfamily sulfate permease-like transporter